MKAESDQILQMENCELQTYLPDNDASENLSLDNIFENHELQCDNFAKSVIDVHYKLLDINKKWLELTGLSREQVIGKKCYKVFYNLTKPCEECTVKEVLTTNISTNFLRSSFEKDRIKFEEKIISPLVDEIGKPQRFLIKSKDLSNYYHLVDKAGQRDVLYQRIFESAGDAFLVHDEEGRLIEFGSKLPKLLGYSKEELKHLYIFDIDDASQSMSYHDRKEKIKEDSYAVFETQFVCKSKKRISVEVSANRLKIGKTMVFFVSIRDITKRKEAENKLRESEERFRTLVENATDLIMRFDKNFRHIFVNSATKKILNIPPEDFIGKTHQEMGFDADKCIFWENEMERVFLNKEPSTVEFSLNVHDQEFFFEWQLIPELDSEGKSETLMAIARDITARKKSESDLNEALKCRDKFFSIIAHDLKNPFNALLPISKMLTENCTTMSKNQLLESTQLIHSAVKQEYNLLENLLEWSRAQVGNLKCTPRKIDVQSLVFQNLKLYETRINEKKIAISIQTDQQFSVYADEYMIDTVIRNLLSNALKFTPENGKISVRFKIIDQLLCTEIKDSGIGINFENQQKLFRLDTNYNRLGTAQETGTGLGLILCKEFIEQNRGSIFVQSEEGKGSSFTFTLPLAH